jgi:hypothetical protein
MTLPHIIILLGMFFWIVPAARQYKSPLFYYFLVFAYYDAVAIIIYSLTGYTHLKLLFALILVYSVVYSLTSRRTSNKVLFFSVILLVLDLFFMTLNGTYYQIAIHSVIIYLFFRRTITFVALKGSLNIFHLFLLLEEFSLIFKFLANQLDPAMGTLLFYLTTFFQLFIAIFFSIFREEDEKLLIPLRNT